MCGDAIKESYEPAGNFFAENPWLKFVAPLSPATLFGPSLRDFSSVDADDVQPPPTRLEQLKDVGHETKPSNIMAENFSATSFEDIRKMFLGATAPQGTAEKWGAIRNGIIEATQDFENGLAALKDKGGLKGATYEAATAKIEASLTEPAAAASGAGAMEILVNTWTRTMDAINSISMAIGKTTSVI